MTKIPSLSDSEEIKEDIENEACLAKLTSHFFLGENEVPLRRLKKPSISELQLAVENEGAHLRLWDVDEDGVLFVLKKGQDKEKNRDRYQWQRRFVVARSRAEEREILFFSSHDTPSPVFRERVVVVQKFSLEQRRKFGARYGFVVNNFVCQCLNEDAERWWFMALSGENHTQDLGEPRFMPREDDKDDSEGILSFIGDITFEMKRLEYFDTLHSSSKKWLQSNAVTDQKEEDEGDEEANNFSNEIPSPPTIFRGSKGARFFNSTIRRRTRTTNKMRSKLRRNLVQRMITTLARSASGKKRHIMTHASSLRHPILCRILLLDRTKSGEPIKLMSVFTSDPFTLSKKECDIRLLFRCRSALACLKIDLRTCPNTIDTYSNDSPQFPETQRLCRRTIPMSELVHRDAQRKLRIMNNLIVKTIPSLFSSVQKWLTAKSDDEIQDIVTAVRAGPIKSVVTDTTFYDYDDFHRIKPYFHGDFELAEDLSNFKLAPQGQGWAYYKLTPDGTPEPNKNTKKSQDIQKISHSFSVEQGGIVGPCRILLSQDIFVLLKENVSRNDFPVPDNAIDFEKISSYLERAQRLIELMNDHSYDLFDDIIAWRYPKKTAYIWFASSLAILMFGERHALALVPCFFLFFMVLTLTDRVAANRRLVSTPSLPLPEDTKQQQQHTERPYRSLAFIRLAILEGRKLKGSTSVDFLPNPYVQVSYNFQARRLRPLDCGRTETCFKTQNPVYAKIYYPKIQESKQRSGRARDFIHRSFRRLEKKNSKIDESLVAVKEPSRLLKIKDESLRFLRRNCITQTTKTKINQIDFQVTWIRDDGSVVFPALRIPVLWPVDHRGNLIDWESSNDELQVDVYDENYFGSLLGQIRIPISSMPRDRSPTHVSTIGDQNGWIPLQCQDDNTLSRYSMSWGQTCQNRSCNNIDDEPLGAIKIHCLLELPDEREQDLHDRSAMYTLESMLEVPTNTDTEKEYAHTRIFQLFADTYKALIDNQLALRLYVRYAEQIYGLLTWLTPISSSVLVVFLLVAIYILIAIPTRIFLLLAFAYMFIDGLIRKRRRTRAFEPHPWEQAERPISNYKKKLFNLVETIPCAPELNAAVAEQRAAVLRDFTYDCLRSELLASWSGFLWILRKASKNRWAKRYGALKDSRLILWLKRSEALDGAKSAHEIPLLRGFKVHAGSNGRLLILSGLKITDRQARIYQRLGRVATIIDTNREASPRHISALSNPANHLIIGLRTPLECAKLRQALTHEHQINQGIYEFLRRDKFGAPGRIRSHQRVSSSLHHDHHRTQG
uniref:PH domain-containing protein n=1 Tax=Aureoumbra lagunensis TaxID=44058 RepID=A0A7S3JXE9_9STRA